MSRKSVTSAAWARRFNTNIGDCLESLFVRETQRWSLARLRTLLPTSSTAKFDRYANALPLGIVGTVPRLHPICAAALKPPVPHTKVGGYCPPWLGNGGQ